MSDFLSVVWFVAFGSGSFSSLIVFLVFDCFIRYCRCVSVTGLECVEKLCDLIYQNRCVSEGNFIKHKSSLSCGSGFLLWWFVLCLCI